MENVTRQQVTDAIEELLTGEHEVWPYDYDEPSAINDGQCENFAFAVMAYLDYPENLETRCAESDQPELSGHVWLDLDTKDDRGFRVALYFDSECPEGCIEPSLLPFFQRN